MELNNNTLLGSYLAHLHSKIRRLSDLDFEKQNHPDFDPIKETASEIREQLRENWEILTEQCLELLELQLKPFNELAGPGPFHRHHNDADSLRVLRWDFKKIKLMADKHRRKHPDFTMFKSWDLKAREVA